MIAYSILFICVIISALNKGKLKKLSFILLFIFAALRFNYGNDYQSYLNIFNAIHYEKDVTYKSQFLFWILNLLMPNYYLLVALSSLFFVYSISFLLNKNLKRSHIVYGLFFLLINPYVYLINLSALRQSIAISYYVFAVYFAFKRKIIPYLLFVLFAIMNHTSAIILVPFYFICNEKNISVVKVVILFTLLFLSLIFNQQFNFIVVQILEKLELSKYTQYIDNSGNSLRSVLLAMLILSFLLNNVNRVFGFNKVCVKLYILATVLNILAFNISMLTRLTMFFDVFGIVALPVCIFSSRNRNIKRKNVVRTVYDYFMPYIIIIIFILRFISFIANPLWESFYVYRTILELIL